ncbi:immunity repressor [Gordonia phage Vasanti]|uniref:Immunity repressor n=1 Tax=Gordonia phage Vasanti TaxID=2502431 RepID=A0A411BW09_9CAUD|nr:transcriptional repressor [Gordonia phage Vasanti]QAY05779.1 immunity repressor [Gordonia phage Vasanti]
MNATSLRDLLQQAVDRRNAQGQDASFRALQEAVEAEENSHPRGLSLNRTTASQIVRGSYKGEPSDGTIRAIGWLAGVDDEDAFAAAGRRSPGLPFAEELPPGVDDLSPKERRAAIEMLRTLVAQRREINRYVDSSSGPQEPAAPREADPREKTRGKVTALPRRDQADGVDHHAAARRGEGKSKGERLRDQLAQVGEEADPPGPETGA